MLATDDKPKLESVVLKSSSPGLRPVEPPGQRREPSSPAPDPHPPEKSELPPSIPEVAQCVIAAAPVPTLSPSKPISAVDAAEKLTPPAESSPAQAVTPEPDKPEPEQVPPEVPASAAQALKAVNGLVETETTPPPPPPHDDSDFLPPSQSSTEPSTVPETYSLDVKAASPPVSETVSSGTMTPSLPTAIAAAAAAAAVIAVPTPPPGLTPPGLTHPGQTPVEASPAQTASPGPELRDAGKEAEVALEEKVESTLQSNLRQNSSQGTYQIPQTL